MTAPPPVADQFLYTAASFGNAGSEGFQFVGLPARGASVDALEKIERHVGYAAPLDMPAEPDDATIARRFPVSTRLLYPEGGAQAALVSSRYAGRVYRADGQRGKWGNFVVHALLVDAPAAPASLAGLALEVPWRTGLSEGEHAAAQPLALEGLPLGAPRAPAPADAPDIELLAGVILRLCGGPPVLLPLPDAPDLPEPGHALALVRYARVQPLLPTAALRRLSWSSYEFDGASGYDVVATVGRTQLSMSPGGYFVPGETAAPADAAWAAGAAARDPAHFWALLQALAGPALEAAPLRKALSALMAFDAPDGPDAALAHDTLAALRRAPADEALVAQARRLFERAWPPARMTGFAAIVAAFGEARALGAWSGRDDWGATAARAASDAPALLACFTGPADAQPLAAALRETSALGLAPDEAVHAAADAAAPHLDAGRHEGVFVQALQAFAQQASSGSAGVAGWVGVLARLARTPRHRPIASALWCSQSQAAGGAWFDAVRAGLRRAAPEFEAEAAPPLVARLVEFYAARGTELAWCVDALDGAGAPAPRQLQLPLAPLLERLDVQVAEDTDAARRAALAARLVRLRERWPPPQRPAETCIANCVLLDAARDPRQAQRLVADGVRFDALARAAHAGTCHALADAAWRAAQGSNGRPPDADAARQLYCQLWRPDIAAPFAETVTHSLAADLQRHGDAVAYIARALAGAPRGPAQALRAWQSVVEALALHLAPRLDDAQFERLVAVRGLDAPLRQALRARRAGSLRRLPATIGRFVQGVFGRATERRGRGR
uniref:GAP1-N2 domain-containing protein n=1 Tax=unclassified Variovorax TaxID=663243 RepID=UPI000D398CE2